MILLTTAITPNVGLPWLASDLVYEWFLDISYALGPGAVGQQGRTIAGRVSFDLFSTSYPLLFEVDFDMYFDAYLPNAPPMLKEAVSVFLEYQPLLMTKSSPRLWKI